MEKTNNKQFNKLIDSASRILITGAANPNVDVVSTAVAWWLFLTKKNKQVDLVFDGHIPQYNFWPKSIKFGAKLDNLNKFRIILDTSQTKVKQLSYDVNGDELEINIVPEGGTFSAEDVETEQGDYKYDLIISLGAGSPEALGNVFSEHRHFWHQVAVINIDRSVLNENFGNLNIIKAGATSLAEISYQMLQTNLDKNMATCLLAAMMAATGSFQSPQVKPETLELASQLIIKGADRESVIQALYRTKNIATLKNWGRVLSRLHKHGNIISSFLKHEEVGSLPQDFRDMVRELILSTPEAQVAVIFYQLELDKTEAWIYTIENIDARDLVKDLSVEGHRRFAKITMSMGVDRAKEILVKKVSDKLNIINSA